jgi:hypothetical protein
MLSAFGIYMLERVEEIVADIKFENMKSKGSMLYFS